MKENNNKILRYYVSDTGKIPFTDWIKKIKDPMTRNRIRRRIDRMELGNYGDFKVLGDGVNELKLSFGPGYRIYFSEYDDVVNIILCGGVKKSQVEDIKLAKAYWHELKGRCHE